MSLLLNALDVLVEYPHLQEYIKGFNGPHGFMYTNTSESEKYNCQLDELLDLSLKVKFVK